MRSCLLRLALCWLLAHMHVSDAATTHKKRATDCGKNKFQCKSGACINTDLVCNGVQDCADGSDEDRDSCANVLMPAAIDFVLNELLPPPATCPENKYQCPTGECIDPQLKCNGRIDCPGGADERLPECWSPTPSCNADEFQCKSGSCVPASSICNRKRDCNDGSDEVRSLCGSGPIGDRPCLYPPNIENGEYMVLGCESCTPEPGKPIQDGATILRYTCNPGHKLKDESTDILICRNGQWNANPPTCEQRTCPTLTSESISAQCTQGQSQFTCDWPVPPGTEATVECKAYYTSTSPRQSLTCGIDGQWNNVVMKCNPACGKDRSGNNPLVAHGEIVKGGEFPWHVGIYKNKDGDYINLCGGSLISLKYVLSVAHCFWNNGESKKLTENLYKLIAGKFHRNYSIIDPGQEERAVTNIDIPTLFGGISTFLRDDIAVLTVDKPFTLGENIRPVCVDWDDMHLIEPGDLGHVAGWGLTETGEPSEELHSVLSPVIGTQQCLKQIKPNYQNYFGSDKICAGYKNGTTVCNGDSGGGLTFVREINPYGTSNKAFFVQGMVSSSGGSPEVGKCNLEEYVAFTRVSKFIYFLIKYKQ